jgi:CxxC motif-containing protein
MRELLCIVCPNSCRLEVEEGPQGLAVRGNLCPRGLDFARTEITDPRRTLTTTVRTAFPGIPVVPVRTDGDIPKGKIPELIAFLGGVTLTKPLRIGEAVAENVLGLGRKVILTSDLLGEEP